MVQFKEIRALRKWLVGVLMKTSFEGFSQRLLHFRTMSVHWEVNAPNGVCGLAFDRKDIEMNKLLATCLEGKFHVW